MNDMTQGFLADQQSTAVDEIIVLLARIRDVPSMLEILKAWAATCEAQSELENDDMEIAAQRFDEFRESLADELEVGDDDDATAILDARERARDMNAA